MNFYFISSKYFLIINILSSEAVSPHATFNHLIIFTVRLSPEQYVYVVTEGNNICYVV